MKFGTVAIDEAKGAILAGYLNALPQTDSDATILAAINRFTRPAMIPNFIVKVRLMQMALPA